ncbi:MAG TPA: fasciclin domain-containing protein [Candidatus Limnocylindria bacterium]|nr:fasciclin domain-containing protein [Candidatus Limnocylindria bacterium]
MAQASLTAGTVMVGGQAMLPSRDIVDNAVNSADHTTLVAAVKAAGLVETLKGKGPFTVFAPTNDAFENLPAGTVDGLLKAANKPALVKVLTYHVVPGRLTSEQLRKLIVSGKGSATLKTASGGTLVAMMNGPSNIVIRDESGNVADISTYDVMQSNGVIHVLDQVVLPK